MWRRIGIQRGETEMKVFIVGIPHKHQFGPCKTFPPAEQACDAFAAYLREQCLSHGIRTLAEEMSADARQKSGIFQTVPDCVAIKLGIAHVDCEPDIAEQACLGIKNEGDVKLESWFNDHPEHVVAENIRHMRDKREYEWVRRLSLLKDFPVLLVCGCAHSKSFADKIDAQGIKAQILAEEWEPSTVRIRGENPRGHII